MNLSSPTLPQINKNLNNPPVPPRPRPTANNYDYNYNYNSGLPFGNTLMPSFGLNNFGYGYNNLGFNRMSYPYGNNQLPESELIRLAEERSRTAFQSIESFVHAFQSISMMLESSYMALASSFRAVLGVAEHFSRLRVQVGSIISGLTIFRVFRKYIKNLLIYVGIITGDRITDLEEKAWRQSANAEALANENTLTPEIISANSKSTWPIVAFFAVALGTPYVVYNVLKNIAKDSLKMDTNKWSKGEGEHFVAIANFDFLGEGGHYNGDRYYKELSFKNGEKIFIAPKEYQRAAKGWLLASLNGKIGLVPYNYLSQPVKVNNQIEVIRDIDQTKNISMNDSQA